MLSSLSRAIRRLIAQQIRLDAGCKQRALCRFRSAILKTAIEHCFGDCLGEVGEIAKQIQKINIAIRAIRLTSCTFGRIAILQEFARVCFAYTFLSNEHTAMFTQCVEHWQWHDYQRMATTRMAPSPLRCEVGCHQHCVVCVCVRLSSWRPQSVRHTEPENS